MAIEIKIVDPFVVVAKRLETDFRKLFRVMTSFYIGYTLVKIHQIINLKSIYLIVSYLKKEGKYY